jgi:hypothetical protein
MPCRGPVVDGSRLVEMAREFPDVSFLGVDLAPTWADRVDVPDNAVFELCNVVEGIGCPNETFDVVHCRALMGGVSITLHLLSSPS